MRWFPLLLLALLLPASAAQAQLSGAQLSGLRARVVVEGDTIHLGDLFEDAENGSRALGPAPMPGRRITVEMPQLLAIARTYGVAWRPFSAEERVVIERPGRPLPREEWFEPLRNALIALGMDPDAEVDIPGFAAPMVPPDSLPRVTVEQPSLDENRFAATIAVEADGMPALRLRVAGRVSATVPVAVATRRMSLGEVVKASDVRVQRVRVERSRPGLADDAVLVVGQQLRRPIGEGMPFAVRDLGAPVLIEKNSTVVMVVESNGLTLTAQGRAMADAPRGGIVSVMNLSSRQIVEAQAISPGRVRVGPPPPNQR
ncbi:flagellar basal body P-ring formation chaperone FlgA [Roseomonas elaeocarpi]|uniref:Flagellar basal body P-ring formation chaperone FlgA n=1 Tax=Roseomonas elaeocarpi TaxID=907779 RepID=A0ABV6JQD5_9PROT